ncbi:MAG: hypothetical protein K2X08_06825 [Chlamydiales bacterium]|nr:hypothetical protein [Chlamydiales bacterium]
MIFESIGRFFLLMLKPIFLFLIASLPLVLTSIYIVQKRLDLLSLQTQYEATLVKAYKSLNQRAEKERFISRYSETENYFLDHHIESLQLLQDEILWLQAYEHHPALAEKNLAKERLKRLSAGNNQISFLEEGIKKAQLYQETEEKMKKPVEVNETDLKKLLSLIENVEIGPYQPHPKSPQMIITNFSLKRRNSPFKQETFEVKLDLLKREFKKS